MSDPELVRVYSDTQPEQEVVDDEPEGLSIGDCLQWLGDKKMPLFNEKIANGQRLGQAWFTLLSVDDQDKLKDTPYDPFYKTTWPWVIESLRYLLEE
jgi:hypothetical protein